VDKTERGVAVGDEEQDVASDSDKSRSSDELNTIRRVILDWRKERDHREQVSSALAKEIKKATEAQHKPDTQK